MNMDSKFKIIKFFFYNINNDLKIFYIYYIFLINKII